MNILLLFHIVVIFHLKLYSAHYEIVVHSDHSHQGVKVNISIEKCSNLPEGMARQVTSVNTKDQCARFYSGQNCTGNSIEILPHSPSHGNLVNWNFNDMAVSVGPCRDPCDTGITGTATVEPFDVEIFSRPHHMGYYANVRIEGCTLVPTNFIFTTFSVNTNGRCLQLYNNIKCKVQGNGVKTIELRSGTPYHDDIPYWHFPEAKAISHCRYKCGDYTNSTFRKDVVVVPGKGEIILFDEKNFEGNWLLIKLNNSRCLNMNLDWEGRASSVKVKDDICVILYDRPYCTGANFLVTAAQPDLSNRNFHEVTRSIRICNGNIYPTDSPIGNTSKTWSYSNNNKSGHFSLSPTVLSVVIIVPILGVIISVFLVLFIMRRCHPYKNLMEILSEKEIQDFLSGLGMDMGSDGNNRKDDYSVELLAQNKPYNQAYEIPRSQIKYDPKTPLGMGEYGVVYKGTVTLLGDESSNNSTTIPVAVKTIKPSSGAQCLRALLKEVKVMLYVGKHPHIAHMIGCCTGNLRKGEILMLVEYCPNGSLEAYLQKNRKTFNNIVKKGKIDSTCKLRQQVCFSSSGYINVDDLESGEVETSLNIFWLLQWCVEVAKGMEFLASAKVIHSDLAARNILLSEHLNAKIADFGLSRQLYCYSQYVKRNQEPLPWRWLSIESLKSMEFSSESDVWSFGILCWEIFTLGEKPYPGTVWSESFIVNLEEGLRLGKPKFTLTECYNLLLRCWEEEPAHRPKFSELVEELQEILTSNSNAQCVTPPTNLINME